MIIKYFGSGKSSAGAVEYVEKNQTAKTLKGNNDITRDLISSNTNKLKYRSGVISFGTDKPTKKQVNEIIELFEKSTFAGLEKEQYNILWVEHTDNPKNYHIHFVIPRLELTTMKSFNPHYHKADQKRLLKLQDYINNKYYLINPFEADRRQTLELNTNWKNRNQAKERIDKIVTTAIEKEVINNRDELIEFLQDSGLQVKASKNYISVKAENDKKAIRLKGAYYNENYTSREELTRELKATEREHRKDTYSELTEAREELDRLIEYKAKQVNRQYKQKPKKTRKQDRQIRDTRQSANDMANLVSSGIISNYDNTDTAPNDSRTNEQLAYSDDTTRREQIYSTTREQDREHGEQTPGRDREITRADTTRSDTIQHEIRGGLFQNEIYENFSATRQDNIRQRQSNDIYNNRLGEKYDTTRTTTTRSTTRSRELQSRTFEQLRTTRERIQEQYIHHSGQLQASNERTAEQTYTRITSYNTTAKETQQRSIETATRTTATKLTITTAIKSITRAVKDTTRAIKLKAKEMYQNTRQRASRGFGMSR